MKEHIQAGKISSSLPPQTSVCRSSRFTNNDATSIYESICERIFVLERPSGHARRNRIVAVDVVRALRRTPQKTSFTKTPVVHSVGVRSDQISLSSRSVEVNLARPEHYLPSSYSSSSSEHASASTAQTLADCFYVSLTRHTFVASLLRPPPTQQQSSRGASERATRTLGCAEGKVDTEQICSRTRGNPFYRCGAKSTQM